MNIDEFEKKIQHLGQEEVIATGLSVITKMLVEKDICTDEELQNKFLEMMRGE
jgi:hypothetical protein